MPDKKALLHRFELFCRGLGLKDRVAIVHHSDADGFCSALVAAKAVEKLTGKRPVAVRQYEYGSRKLARKAASAMRRKKANVLVLLDIAVDCESDGILSSCSFEKCLVLDHHRVCKDLGGKRVLFLKSQFFSKREPSSYATSKLAFDLFGKVVDVGEFDWVACVGVLGDMALRSWPAFSKKCLRSNRLSVKDLHLLADLIASVEVIAPGRMGRLFWAFYDSGSPKDVLASRFHKYLGRFEREKETLIRGFKEKAEWFPRIGLAFYAIKARHENIKSYVINEISEKHPHETIILLQYLGNCRVRFSARRQDMKVRVNDLLVEAVKGIPKSSAGGHAPAAAGSIQRNYVGRFKQNVVEILSRG